MSKVEKAAEAYREHRKLYKDNFINNNQRHIKETFEAGARWLVDQALNMGDKSVYKSDLLNLVGMHDDDYC